MEIKLKDFSMKVLNLPVTKEWFNKILSGAKKEDFREIKPYWNKRLKHKYDLVKIVNGYGSTRPTIIAKFGGLRITNNNELTDLGTGCFYAIKIGKFVEVKNVTSK